MLRSKVLLFAALLSLAPGLQAAEPDPAQTAKALNELFDDYFERSLQLNPLPPTFIGDHRYDDRLTNNISPAHVAEALAVDRQFLAAALRVQRPARLSDADRLSLEIFLSDLRTSIDGGAVPGRARCRSTSSRACRRSCRCSAPARARSRSQ